MKSVKLSILIVVATFSLSATAFSQWVKQTVNTTASFRGLSVVSENIIWASGTGGTVIRTIDGGKNWNVIQVPDAAKLDFRDIEAFDANTAYILSIGNGDGSRIYKTTDGGTTWKLQFKNEDPKAFFDAIACWDTANCIAMSDPVDGHYLLISTANGGDKWERIVSNQMAAAVDGEAAFAASGTCLITQGKTNAFIVSGGKDSHVFRSTDRGKTWTSAKSPVISGPSGAGIFSIAMWDANNGVIVGGNYEKPTDAGGTLGFTTDGGATWRAAKGLSGYRSAVTYITSKTILAAGTNGVDITTDGGVTWKVLDTGNYNAVQANTPRAIWAVGPNGAVAKFTYMADLVKPMKVIF